jgi:hypothetical protein
MSQTIKLILGSHSHVPFGAGDDEFEKIYERRLKPFISTLYKYPKIQAVLHYSGVLLHRLERNHPEFFMLITDLLSRKQVEILGGGFYEPMMPIIPIQDRIGQVEMLTTYLRKSFGKKPQGCWLPALAWEQNMVSPLADCGIGYTFLSDNQFRLGGVEDADLYVPCITEDQGQTITVFPISSAVRDDFARKNASDVLNGLARVLPSGSWTVSVFPEELFAEDGASPDFTYNLFFEELSRCESFVEYTFPGKQYRSLEGLKKAYFPGSLECTAGREDGTPAHTERTRRFLIDYPEAGGIYSKMIHVHGLINQLRGDKTRKRNAREELWKAQGYEIYCPAVFRNMYNPGIRKAAYRALLGAEKITREKGRFNPSLVNFDINLDGEIEYIFQDEKINSYIERRGAGVFELDYLPKNWNYLDTFATPDAPGACGSSRRGAFTDWFLPSGFDIRDEIPFSRSRFCGGERFVPAEMDRSRLRMSFTLPARDEETPFSALGMTKTFQSRKDTLTVTYALKNNGDDPCEALFCSSLGFAFSGWGDSVRVLKGSSPVKADDSGNLFIPDADLLKFQDLKNEVQIQLGSKKAFSARISPLYCGAVYQSSSIMPMQKILMAGGETWTTEFSLKFSP